MKLSERQTVFSYAASLLIQYIYTQGYRVSFGDAYRDPRCPYGSRSSRHHMRLAIDLNLFDQDGRYLQDTQSHEPFGRLWESLGGVWGGRWADGNHYEWPIKEDIRLATVYRRAARLGIVRMNPEKLKLFGGEVDEQHE